MGAGPCGGSLAAAAPPHKPPVPTGRNFLEYYHLPAVHPALCDVSGVDEHERRQGKGMYMCFATEPLNGESTQGATAIDPGQLQSWPGIGARNQNTAWHLCLFPNVFFSLYPDNFFRVILQADGCALPPPPLPGPGLRCLPLALRHICCDCV